MQKKQMKRLTDANYKELYEITTHCKDIESIKNVIYDVAPSFGILGKTLRAHLMTWCRKNNLTPPSKIVMDNVTKKLIEMVSKDPSNITEVLRKYVAKTYPELTAKGNEAEFNRRLNAVRQFWYSKVSKNHTCFMVVSKKGGTVINRKGSKIVNNTYEKPFLKNLKKHIIDFFKSIF